MLEDFDPPTLPGLIAAEPTAEVVEAVAGAMAAEVPLSNLYFASGLDPLPFAEALAGCLAGGDAGAGVSREAADLRASYGFRAEHDPGVHLWHGGSGGDWPLIFEDSPLFATPPARRTLFLKPWPEDPAAAFRFVAAGLPAILVFPGETEPPIAGVRVLPMLTA